MVPAMKEPIAAVASAWAARPRLAILLPSMRGHHRRGLTRGVEQDRGRRAAVHAAVVDAGEHDERLGRLEAVGHRQQQRDRHRRADAGQHADEGAEQHADGGVHQVLGRERGLEAVQQQVEGVHQRIPSRIAGGQRDAEADVEEVPAAHGQHRARRARRAQACGCPAPTREPANSTAPVIAQPSRFTSSDVEHHDADQLADGDPVGRLRQVDVLAGLGLGHVATEGGDREQHREQRASRRR